MPLFSADSESIAADLRAGWLPAPTILSLPAGELHVWRAFEACFVNVADTVGRALSEDERARAVLFRREPDRLRFATCRGILRTLLSRYQNLPAADIRFQNSEYGKPELIDGSDPPLAFNVSHTQGMALFAFARAGPIGVDVEIIRDTPDFPAIGERFLHPSEWQVIAAAPSELLPRRFFECWTAKEACLKADGRGLSAGPELLHIDPPSPQPASQAKGTSEDAAAGTASYWIGGLDVGPGFAAAVATTTRPERLRCWDWR